MSLSSLSGAPPPGVRKSTQDTGGAGPPLSSLSGAPSLSGNKPKPTFGGDDDDVPAPTPSRAPKTTGASSSGIKSSVRKSTPNPPTSRMETDDFPRASSKNRSVRFGEKSPFDDDDDPPPRASAAKDPIGGSTSRGMTRSSSSKPSTGITGGGFNFDDDSPPRSTTGAGRSGAGRIPFGGDDDDDFLSSMHPDSVFKGGSDPLGRPASVRASTPTLSKPGGMKADDRRMMKDDPKPILPDLGLDLFGASASKPAAGPRAGRRAQGVQQSTPELSPEQSRDPTPEASRRGVSPEPSGLDRRLAPGLSGDMQRSSSAPRGTYQAPDDFMEAPSRSTASVILPNRGRTSGETGPSFSSMAPEGSTTSPPGRTARRSGGDGGGSAGGGMELDGDDLPGLGSPALAPSTNLSTTSIGATGGQATGRRSAPAPAPKPRKEDDSWEMDDNLLPDESNTPAARPPPSAAPPPPPSPPAASSSTWTSASTPSSGTPPGTDAPGRSRLQHTTFGGPKKDEEPRDEDEPSMGGYTPSFGPRRPSSGSGMFGGGAGGGGGSTAASTDFGGGYAPSASGYTPSGSGYTPSSGGPGAPRPRRQLGASADTSPMGTLSSTGGPFGGPAAKAAGPPVKKTKDEEEKERVAAEMAAGQARRAAARAASTASGPIRAPVTAPPPAAPAPAPAPNPAAEAGVVPTPASPSPIRPGARSPIGGMGFGKKPGAGLGLSSDSSDDDLPLPDKATSPPLPQMASRKANTGGTAHQPQRATSTAPLGREAYDSRVASSVPEMGAAASAAALGTVPGPGPGSIVQSSAPAPPLHQEVSYPPSVTSQPSAPSPGAATPPAATAERSGMSLPSQPSGPGGAPGGGPPAVISPLPQQQLQAQQSQQQAHSGVPPGVTPLAPQLSLPPGVTSLQPQQSGLPPGVTAMQPQQSQLLQQQTSLPPGVTAMQPQQQGLPPGVTSMQPPPSPQQPPQQPGLPPGVIAMQPQQQQGLPPGVTAMQAPHQPQGLPPGVTALQQPQQQQGPPPVVTQLTSQNSFTRMTVNPPQPQQQNLPPGGTSLNLQQGAPPAMAMPPQQQQGLPPGVSAQIGVTPFQPQQQQQQQGYPPGMSPMQQQPQQQQQLPQGMPQGMYPLQQQQGMMQMQPQGMQPQQQQAFMMGVMGAASQHQGSPPGLTRTASVGPQRLSPEPSSVNMIQSPDGRHTSHQHPHHQQQFQHQQQQQQQQHSSPHAGRQSVMSTAFAVPPESQTAVAVSRAMPPQLQPQERGSPELARSPGSLAIPGSGYSPGEITLASQRLPIEALKESLVKSLQEELEKMSRQVLEVKTAYDKQITDVRKEHERTVYDMRLQHDKQLSEARGMAERQVEEARVAHRKQLEELHANHERQMEDVRRRTERQSEEIRAVQERQLAEARAQREKLVEDARAAQMKALEDARGQHLKALEDTRALHDKVLADTQAVHVKQVVELKNLYESELRRAAHDIGRAVDDTRRVAEEARRQEAEARRTKEEVTVFRDRILGLETEIRARDAALRESETRFVQLDTRNKTELAETQATAIKEAALMKLEMEDAKAALGRVRTQYEEAAMAHAQELTRYRAELDAQRVMAAEELQRARLAAAEQIAAAEARGRRAGMLDKEIAEATIRQQMAAIAEEKEVVSRHRLSAELLAQLTEKVRAVAVSSIEREERALSALERDVADREGRLAAREKLLGEREGRVAQREKEVDALRADLQNLMVTLETSAVHDREDLKREQLRLTREAARVEAASSSLQAEREDLRVQIQMEKRLLEEAREARRKEREDLLTEVTAERRRLATEYADTQRALDAARTELLAVRSRLVDLESRRNGTVAQVTEEEKRLEALKLEAAQTRQALDAEVAQAHKALESHVTQTRQALTADVNQTRDVLRAEVSHTRESVYSEVTQMREALAAEVTQTREALAAEVNQTRNALAAEVAEMREAVQHEVLATRDAVQQEASDTREALRETKEAFMLEKANVDLEARELVEYAARLQAQSAELAAQAADADARRTDLNKALESLAASQAELQEAQKQLQEAQQQVEGQRVALDGLKKALDRDRLAMAEERKGLSEERLAASRAADEARSEQLRLTEAVRVFVQQGVPIPFAFEGSTVSLKPVPPTLPPALPYTTPDKHQPHSSKRRSAPRRPTGRSRNALKHMLDRLGVDAAVAAITSPPGGGLGIIGTGVGASTALSGREGVIVVTGASGGPGAGGGSGSSYVQAQQEFLEKMRLSTPSMLQGVPQSAGPKLTSLPVGRDASPIPVPPGLNPMLLPPGLAAAHARSTAVTPVKHGMAFSSIPVGAPLVTTTTTFTATDTPGSADPGGAFLVTAPGELESERPTPARAIFGNTATTDTAGATFRSPSTSPSRLRPTGVGDYPPNPPRAADIAAAMDQTLFGSPPGSSTGVIQQLLETIQMALQKSSRVNVVKGGGGPSLDGSSVDVTLARRQPLHRGTEGEGGSRRGPGGGLPRLDLAALPTMREEDEDQVGGRLLSEIASLVPLSSSSTSLDLLDAPPHADSPDTLLGALGPHLDALAEELSSSTGGDGLGGGGLTHAVTPANTVGSRFPWGASIGSEDAFGGAGGGGGFPAAVAFAQQQRQLGELAVLSEVLAARLGALGVGGELNAPGAGAGGSRAAPGAISSHPSIMTAVGPASETAAGSGIVPALSIVPPDAGSVYSSSTFSPRVGAPGSDLGIGGAAAAMSRQASTRLSPSSVTGPSARSLLWGGPGSLARSLTGGNMGGSGLLGATSRSAADTPLLGSANAEALQGVTLPNLAENSAVDGGGGEDEGEDVGEVVGGLIAGDHGGVTRTFTLQRSLAQSQSQHDHGTLSAIASVDSLSDDEEDELDDDDATGLLP